MFTRPDIAGTERRYAKTSRRSSSVIRRGNSNGMMWLSTRPPRRLKPLDVNLLAGRALNRQCLPLTAAEPGFEIDVDRTLRFGLLPDVHNDPGFAVDILDAYVATCLREEIQQEALVRRLDAFARFLQVADAAQPAKGRHKNAAPEVVAARGDGQRQACRGGRRATELARNRGPHRTRHMRDGQDARYRGAR